MNLGSVSSKTRVPRPGFLACCTYVLIHCALSPLPFDSSTPGDDLDRGHRADTADLESHQDLDGDNASNEEGTERQVTSPRIKERVATEITKDKNRQRKYHTKKSAQRSNGGRVKGSKPKNSVKQQVASAGWF